MYKINNLNAGKLIPDASYHIPHIYVGIISRK
jgi:hypothetical protein